MALHWVFVLMLGSFVGGAFVGLHPHWVPVSVQYFGTDADGDGSQRIRTLPSTPPPSQSSVSESTQPTTQAP
jgi:hypothetical protein